MHPVAQVRGYCSYLTDFMKALHDIDDAVAGAAYLHNATNESDVAALYDYPQDAQGGYSSGPAAASSSSFYGTTRRRDPWRPVRRHLALIRHRAVEAVTCRSGRGGPEA